MKICFAIVTYQTSRFLRLQLSLIKRLCLDINKRIVVCDNSIDSGIAKDIEGICDLKGIAYIRLECSNVRKSSSFSHAAACIESYERLSESFDCLVLLDHDIFPVRNFKIQDIIKDKCFAGRQQIRKAGDKQLNYIWPGLIIINCKKADVRKVKFDPIIIRGVNLDTGGALNPYLEELGEDVFYINDELKLSCGEYMYDSIYNNTFFHIVNGSNWSKENNDVYNLRINTLISFIKRVVSK